MRGRSGGSVDPRTVPERGGEVTRPRPMAGGSGRRKGLGGGVLARQRRFGAGSSGRGAKSGCLTWEGVMNLRGYFDGACEPVNPGGTGAYGWWLAEGGREVSHGGGGIPAGPETTNNVAEWSGALDLLEAVEALEGPTSVVIHGDSQLVCKQLTGEWQCKNARMRQFRDQCLSVIERLRSRGVTVAVEWVPRERNQQADALSQQFWQAETNQPFPERHKC